MESQELKLRKLRTLRGQPNPTNGNQGPPPASVTADLESIRALFNEKEKELSLAVQKVEDLTHQLEELRSGRINNNQRYPPQLVELERLRRELAYRKQLNEQQNNMIAQQRAQLSMGKEEMSKIDERIIELQDRLARKRLMNQQLASQISAATSAKQAQLRAIQQGMVKNKNKPVSTVEPFQRNHQAAPITSGATNMTTMSTASGFKDLEQNIDNKNEKYQTLPFNTKFKIEALKQEKENNNVQFASDLPPPPPLPVTMANLAVSTSASRYFDHQGNVATTVTSTTDKKPVSSVAPSVNANFSATDEKVKPALPPKPSEEVPARSSPPPYKPAPPPTAEGAAITILKGDTAPHNLSVSAYPHPAEEGTSVDDDATVSAPNVHISINRRIEMPPAFHFPEDQTPPSDLVSNQPPLLPRDLTDNASMYPMMNQIYKEFDHLTTEEQKRIQSMFAAAVESREKEQEEAEADDEEISVPVVVEDNKETVRPKGIIRSEQGEEGKTSHDRRVMFDPLALLLDASLEGELDLVMKTAKEVSDPSAANDEGITALHNAICAGHLDIVEFLVEFGCDVNAQDSDGWTPLHCAASCNNLPMVKFLVEHGACIFATTLSDQETAAEKCEEDEEGFDGCSEYLYSIQEKLGTTNNGQVFAVYDYEPTTMSDELKFSIGQEMTVIRKGDELEKEWWWSKLDEGEGYIPRNLLGLYPRVKRNTDSPMIVESETSS